MKETTSEEQGSRQASLCQPHIPSIPESASVPKVTAGDTNRMQSMIQDRLSGRNPDDREIKAKRNR